MRGLEARSISTFYGTSHVLHEVSLTVPEGSTVCLLGRNGAGKTTVLRSLMGLTAPRSGDVLLDGEPLTGRPADEIARRGVGFVPEDRIIFPDLTVRENLEIGRKANPRAGTAWSVDRIYALFPPLEQLDGNLGAYLSGGEQQMLAIGRTLMGNPTLLLMDEPVEGVAPVIVQALARQVAELKGMGLTMLFSEQNLAFSETVSDKLYLIETGRIRWEGTFAELDADPLLKQKYLTVGE